MKSNSHAPRVVILSFVLLLCVPSFLFAGGNREEEPVETVESDETATEPRDSTPIVTGDRAAATVNGQAVPLAQYQILLEANVSRYAAQGRELSEAETAMLGEQLLEGLVTREVLLQEASRLGIDVSDEEFDMALQQFQDQFPNESQYRIALESEGLSVEQFESELLIQLRVNKLVTREVLAKVQVTPEMARDYYDANPQEFRQGERVAARHIIISTQDLETEAELTDARERAEAARSRVEAGEDFAAVAVEVSEGPSAPNGGDLGIFGRGQMVPAFEEVAFALDTGEISGIVETQFGYHVLQVTERFPAESVSFEEIGPQIQAYLTEQEQAMASQEYVSALRSAATVETHIEF